MLQKKAHVPKFGNWDGDDNVPYTAYFDTARKDKGRGVMINPNDPEQNPEAFMFGGGDDNDSVVFHAFQAPPLHNNAHHDMTDQKHKVETHKVKNASNRSLASESSSDKSTSDHSSLPFSNRHTRSDRKTSLSDVNNLYPSSPGPKGLRNGHNPYDDLVSKISVCLYPSYR